MATTVEAPVSTKTKGRILVVDDELVVRDSLGKWFTSEGYTARPASGAREALEIIQQSEFDIALIDIKMPGMDGIALALAVARDLPKIPILLMTGYADQRERAAGLDALICGIVAKPFNLSEIKSAVASAIAKGRR